MQKCQTANLNIYLIDICVAQHSVQYVKFISRSCSEYLLYKELQKRKNFYDIINRNSFTQLDDKVPKYGYRQSKRNNFSRNLIEH